MKKLAVLILAATGFAAQAQCVGSGSLQTCFDSSGNSYTINRMGNYTHMDGNNSRTGSNWSQDSYSSGNITNHWGRAANGNSWNGTTINSGGTQFHFGTDSNGRSFNKICTQAGCF